MSGIPIKSRLVWLDWMKTLAIYLIIAGHCNVPGFKYVYVFSVPAFFMMSGFLSKKENDFRTLVIKMWWNLILPMIILFFIHLLYSSIYKLIQGNFEIVYFWKRIIGATIGMQQPGLGVLWFVYTLIICKSILQIIPAAGTKKWLLIISLFMLVLSYLYNTYLIKIVGIIICNSIVNVLLAMPFFTMGYLMKPYKCQLTNFKLIYMPFVMCVSLSLIILCGKYNEIVFLFRCSYGNNLMLCVIGGIAGTIFLWGISRIFENFLTPIVDVIGGGTIIILGLHGIMMSYVALILDFEGILKYLEALMILLSFVPIILIIKKYVPIIYGLKRY